MNILLTSYGSTGDIFPVIALGAECARRGHRVSFATSPLYRSEIERAGLRYLFLPPDWPQSQYNEAMLQLTRARTNLETLQIIYRHSIPFLEEIVAIFDREIAATDLVVSSYIVPYYRTLAERQNKPFAVVTFTPNVVPSDSNPPPHPLAAFPVPKPFSKALNRLNWKLSGWVVDHAINRVVGKPLRKLGIPKFRNWLLHPADCALVSVSRALFEPEGLKSGPFHFVGYMRWQSPVHPETLDKVKTFCGGQRHPVLTFGSVTFKNRDEVLRRFLASWPKDRKLILQKGWIDFELPDGNDHICLIGSVSHDALFAHASVIIHHGGAGTTSSALHAGVPQIVVPHIGDQWFWGSQVKRLGVGIKIARRSWPERLPAATTAVLENNTYLRKAAEVRSVLAQEDGPGEAVRILEDFVSEYPSRENA